VGGYDTVSRGVCYPEGGSCYLILELDLGQKNNVNITFEKIPLDEIKESILRAKDIFKRFDEAEANKRKQAD